MVNFSLLCLRHSGWQVLALKILNNVQWNELTIKLYINILPSVPYCHNIKVPIHYNDVVTMYCKTCTVKNKKFIKKYK